MTNKNMTDHEIIKKFYNIIGSVNRKKQYLTGNLKKDEKKKVINKLNIKLGLDEEQSLWLFSKEFVNKPVRDTLLSIVGLEKESEKCRFDTFIRRINIQMIFALCFYGLFVLLGLLLDFIFIIIKNDYTIDMIIVINCVVIPLGLAGILLALINYRFFSYKKFIKNDQLISIRGKPNKIKIIFKIKYETGRRISYLDTREILGILLFFDIDGVKTKCLIPITPYRYIDDKNSSARKKVKLIKEKLTSRDIDIRYYNKSKLVHFTSFDFDSFIDKMKNLFYPRSSDNFQFIVLTIYNYRGVL